MSKSIDYIIKLEVLNGVRDFLLGIQLLVPVGFGTPWDEETDRASMLLNPTHTTGQNSLSMREDACISFSLCL